MLLESDNCSKAKHFFCFPPTNAFLILVLKEKESFLLELSRKEHFFRRFFFHQNQQTLCFPTKCQDKGLLLNIAHLLMGSFLDVAQCTGPQHSGHTCLNSEDAFLSIGAHFQQSLMVGIFEHCHKLSMYGESNVIPSST